MQIGADSGKNHTCDKMQNGPLLPPFRKPIRFGSLFRKNLLRLQQTETLNNSHHLPMDRARRDP
jgi:hypothetical protein